MKMKLRYLIPLSAFLLLTYRLVDADPLDEYNVVAFNNDTQELDIIATANPKLSREVQRYWCRKIATALQEKYPKAEIFCPFGFADSINELRGK